MSGRNIHPDLTEPDLIVLDNLFEDIANDSHNSADQRLASISSPWDTDGTSSISHQKDRDQIAIEKLKALNDPSHPDFQPTVFVTWDDKNIPASLNRYVVKPYTRIAMRIVRHPTDVVFLTHLLAYLSLNVPSAILLFYHFTYLHGVLHVAWTFWWTGSFTLMMHNHIHNNGVLARSWAWLDLTFPYVMYPIMGHTWNSYYYHHVKHHHVEGNGPDDLSSTVRYQRDNVFHFLHYLGRFLFFVWLDLPLYFLRKGKKVLAAKSFGWEAASLTLIYYLAAHVNTRAATFTLIMPFVLLRLGMMIGNWGQHALVDELQPDSDFRSSITLIDLPSNRYCFNDGYHTAHHLNSKRHWREQPLHFLQSKDAYRKGRALTFHNIDYLMMTFKLLQKDYMHLANCLVPMGDQVGMTQQEIADMLRSKTKRFSEEEIRAKFGAAYVKRSLRSSLTAAWTRFAAVIPAVFGLQTKSSKGSAASESSRRKSSCAARPVDIRIKEHSS